MIKIKKLILGELFTNCYIVWSEITKDAIIIDPAESADTILSFINQNNLNARAVLLTHGHYDHIGACYDLQMKGIPIYIHEFDAAKCRNNYLNLSKQFAPQLQVKTFEPNVLITGETFFYNFGSIELLGIHTPGHSDGSCSYVICNYKNSDIKNEHEKHLFSGDAIFDNGFGRFDFYDGSREKTIRTVKMLKKMVDDGYILHAGH